MRDADQQELLRAARAAIAARLTGEAAPPVPTSGAAAARSGVFVTLHLDGKLRGCIGRLEPDQPLGIAVADCAVLAATADPRFPPVAAGDVDRLQIELSVLGPRELIGGPEDVEVGRHGLMVESGGRRGVLLPQVAPEWGWDAARFVAETCRKAGLSPDAWKTVARLWRFKADVFGDGSRPQK